MLYLGGRNPPITDEQDSILTELFLLCEGLRKRRHGHGEMTNRELVAKYGMSERTVRNWRRQGCPFAEGERDVVKWMARRRYVPARTKAKFGRRLEDERLRWWAKTARQGFAELQQVLWLNRKHGITVSDCLSGIQPKCGKVQYFDSVTLEPLENSLNYDGPASATPSETQ